MKKSNLSFLGFLFFAMFLISCEKKKTGNDFLFILSFDPLDYFKADTGGSTAITDVSDSVITSSTDSSATPATSTITTPTGSPFTMNSADLDIYLPLPDGLPVIDLGDDEREAFISIADKNINSCDVLGTFASVTCSLSGFAIEIGNALKNATAAVDIQVRGTNVDKGTTDSNTLTAKKYVIRKFAITNATGTLDNSSDFVTFDDKMYFKSNQDNAGLDNTHAYMFSYDGTTTINQITNLQSPALTSDNATPLEAFGDELIFTAEPTVGVTKLFSYNGTAVEKILSLNGAATDTFSGYATFNDEFYIAAGAGAAAKQLYRYDGGGFDQMTNFTSGITSVVATTTDGVYYLTGDVSAAGLCRLNTSATNNKHIRISNAAAGNFDHTNSEYFVINDTLYFTANFNSTGMKVYKVDTDDIKRVGDLVFSNISVYDNVAYGQVGTALYRFNGSQFEKLTPSTIAITTQFGSTKIKATPDGVYFVVDEDSAGTFDNHLYRYKNRRIERLVDLDNVVAASSIDRMYYFSDKLYFDAKTAAGEERTYRVEAVE